jgi:nitrite reductase/ring-hydroxylating ferredoxin subunit
MSQGKAHVVCSVQELPPGSRRISPLGQFGIGLFNVGGRYYALANYCPHRGGPLCRGVVTGTTEVDDADQVRWVQDGEVIRCPWHGWEFSIPSGLSLTKPVKRVHTYPVRVEDDNLVIFLDKVLR